MIIILKCHATEDNAEELLCHIKKQGAEVSVSKEFGRYIFSLQGNVKAINCQNLNANSVVECVMPVKDAYRKTSRQACPSSTVVSVMGKTIGSTELAIIAGPCSVEDKEQVFSIAESIKRSGAQFFRGGAFKPRTSPYSFQGLELAGLELLKNVKQATGLPIVSEIMSTKWLDIYEKDVDIIQVGARSMQNFDMLKELGKIKKPILLKRGLSSTIEELLMSAEYILAGGNSEVILCERGIRTFETYTRNTLDISAVPILKRITHLPVILDPSHAAGIDWLVEPLAMAAVAAGVDGLIIEVHNAPERAKCDGEQSLEPEQFARLMSKLEPVAKIFGKRLAQACTL